MTTQPAASSISKSTATFVSSSVWQSGISSGVRLAAMMPAMRAAARTSPLGTAPSRMAASVAACMCTSPQATAVRPVAALSPTSTMLAWPWASRWVRVDMGHRLPMSKCGDDGAGFQAACGLGQLQQGVCGAHAEQPAARLAAGAGCQKAAAPVREGRRPRSGWPGGTPAAPGPEARGWARTACTRGR